MTKKKLFSVWGLLLVFVISMFSMVAFYSESNTKKIEVGAVSDNEGILNEAYLNEYSYSTDTNNPIHITNYTASGNSGWGNILSRAFDRNWNTFWETGKQNETGFVNNIIVTFNDIANIDRFIYAVRQDGYNGRGYPKKMSVYVSTSLDQNDFVPVGVAESNVTMSKVIFQFDKEYQARRIKLEFNEIHGDTGLRYASASEIIFLKSEGEAVNTLYDIFEDYKYSKFKSEYTHADVRDILKAVKNTVAYNERDLVKNLYNRAESIVDGTLVIDENRELTTGGDIPTIGRYGDIVNYAQGELKMIWQGTNRQATGIAASEKDKLVVYVECEEGDPLPAITFTQHIGHWSRWCGGWYQLKPGINYVSVPNLYDSSWGTPTNPGGPIYLVNPYTEKEQSANVKIYIEGGYTFPVFRTGEDVQEYKDELGEYLDNYAENPAVLNDLTELVGNRVILTLTSTMADKYYLSGDTSPQATVDGWDNYLKQLYEFAGVTFDSSEERYDERVHYLNVNIRVMQPWAAAYAFGEHVGIQKGGEWEHAAFRGNSFGWGHSHELGHMMDIGERTWTETTNNMWAQFNKTFIMNEGARGNFAGFWEVMVPDDAERIAFHKRASDALPWWMIESRFPGFWANFENCYRYENRQGITNVSELHVYFASIASGIDLTYYFERMGFYWNEGNPFNGYQNASSQYKTAMQNAIREGRIVENQLKLWYAEPYSYNYMIKYGDELGIYNGSQQFQILNISKSGDSNYSLILPEISGIEHLGFEVLRSINGEDYKVVGFTYNRYFVDKNVPQDSTNVKYKIVAYDRLLNKSNESEAMGVVSKPIAELNGHQYNSIKDAVLRANADDIIYLLDSTYESGIEIQKNITIQPKNKDITISINDNKVLFSVFPGVKLSLKGNGENNLILDGINMTRVHALIYSRGDVYVYENVIVQNVNRNNGIGGVFELNQGTIKIHSGAVFRDNKAVKGAIIGTRSGGNSNIIIDGAEIYENYADNGAVVYSNGYVQILNSNIHDNEAKYGGAAFNDAGAVTTIKNSMFSRNMAIEGGALWLDGSTNIDENTTRFLENEAERGGAIYAHNNGGGRKLSIKNAYFENNIAYQGEAIFAKGVVDIGEGNTTIEFVGNRNNIGGTIYIGENSNVNIKTTSFKLLGSVYLAEGKILNFTNALNVENSLFDFDIYTDKRNINDVIIHFATPMEQVIGIKGVVYIHNRIATIDYDESGQNVIVKSFKYNVDVVDEEIVKNHTIVAGEEFELPKANGKFGYRFIGWEVSGEIYQPGNKVVILDDTTITAKYVKEYTLVLDDDRKINVILGEVVDLGMLDSEFGYEFKGYFLDGKYYKGEITIDNEILRHAVNNTINLTSVFEKIKYDIVFDGIDNSSSVSIGDSIDLPILDKKGYDFIGWRLGDKVYSGNITITEDILVQIINGEKFIPEYQAQGILTIGQIVGISIGVSLAVIILITMSIILFKKNKRKE